MTEKFQAEPHFVGSVKTAKTKFEKKGTKEGRSHKKSDVDIEEDELNVPLLKLEAKLIGEDIDGFIREAKMQKQFNNCQCHSLQTNQLCDLCQQHLRKKYNLTHDHFDNPRFSRRLKNTDLLFELRDPSRINEVLHERSLAVTQTDTSVSTCDTKENAADQEWKVTAEVFSIPPVGTPLCAWCRESSRFNMFSAGVKQDPLNDGRVYFPLLCLPSCVFWVPTFSRYFGRIFVPPRPPQNAFSAATAHPRENTHCNICEHHVRPPLHTLHIQERTIVLSDLSSLFALVLHLRSSQSRLKLLFVFCFARNPDITLNSDTWSLWLGLFEKGTLEELLDCIKTPSPSRRSIRFTRSRLCAHVDFLRECLRLAEDLFEALRRPVNPDHVYGEWFLRQISKDTNTSKNPAHFLPSSMDWNDRPVSDRLARWLNAVNSVGTKEFSCYSFRHAYNLLVERFLSAVPVVKEERKIFKISNCSYDFAIRREPHRQRLYLLDDTDGTFTFTRYTELFPNLLEVPPSADNKYFNLIKLPSFASLDFLTLELVDLAACAAPHVKDTKEHRESCQK